MHRKRVMLLCIFTVSEKKKNRVNVVVLRENIIIYINLYVHVSPSLFFGEMSSACNTVLAKCTVNR